MKTTSEKDDDLRDAECRMSLRDALAACGETLTDVEHETTIHDSHGDPVVSFWPTTSGHFDARWHRRERCDDMDGSVTCTDGDAAPNAYYSTY